MTLLSIIAAYLLGATPWGYLLARWRMGADIRTLGSGNIGAANVWRQGGRGLGLAVLLLDAGKGWAAVWLASYWSGGSPLWMSLAAIAAMLGHAFPVFLRFRGGKAVATFFGCFAFLAPLPTLAIALLWLISAGITRQTSVGSTLSVATFPLALWLISHPTPEPLAAALGAAALVLWRHQDNFRRIKDGTEARIHFGTR
ncbi:MAG: glycerol-3-phosphate 1-O-acyltransferase PlsY [Acidobacteriia bacterium]|nr:glycerol-3-phosphate 1-O-acyltransferase PlsY [Terriglobia bacterium]